MSDQNNNNNNNNNPPSHPRPTSNQGGRIGRIGDWSGTGGTNRSSSGPRFATLRDLGGDSSSRGGGPGGPGGGSGPPSHGHTPVGSDSEDEDSGRQGQEWFTGGERSGLSVQNPNRGGGPDSSSRDIIQNLLRKAHEAGYAPSAAAGPTARSVFSGTGHTLGSDEVESQIVPDPNSASASQPSSEERVARHITFWRNGFSIEDGPLLSYTDPQNAEILRAIDAGQAPAELLNVHYGQPVELLVDRRTDEDYAPPKPRARQAFEGAGHRLGAPTPPIAGASGSAAVRVTSGSGVPATAQSTGRADDAERVQTKFEVDQSQPTTSIQLRLADGTRMLCRMNLTHTVRDIRNFINAARPENLTRPYTISTTFPNRVLDDDMQTIEAANLKNSVVVQRWVTEG